MLLPLLIPNHVGSPFDSPSSFAYNWLLVSPDLLVKQRLLTQKEARDVRISGNRVHYAQTNRTKRHVLGLAWLRFQNNGSPAQQRAFARFCREERWWLDDYALYMAIKDRAGGAPWHRWPQSLRNRKPRALTKWRQRHKDEIRYFRFGQWIAAEQWRALRRYAHRRGVRIIGNLPHFVTYDSVDVWAHRSYFQLGRGGHMLGVVGAPPDQYNALGQRWGYPPLHWRAMAKNHFSWWLQRLGSAFGRYDIVVLDHFRGYESFWHITDRSRYARNGRWERGPGVPLMKAIRRAFPRGQCILEDLGNMTTAVHALRERSGYPGMRILQFGFGGESDNWHVPANFPRKSVALTGTHDNHTSRGWLAATQPEERRRALHLLHATPQTFAWKLIEAGAKSASQLFLVPIQDVLNLGNAARLNIPSIERNNWEWRLPATAWKPALAQRLRNLAHRTHRTTKKER